MTRPRWRRAMGIALVSVAAGLIVAVPPFLGKHLGERIVFHGRPLAEWQTPTPVRCSSWLKEVGFQGSDFSCDQTLAFPTEHHFAQTARGTQAHYAEYALSGEVESEGEGEAAASATGLSSARPLWVHFHGVNGNYLHGARYLPAAQRLGFDLVAAEYVNHGMSSYDGRGAGYGCKESQDVVAVIKDLLTRYPQRQILVSATSMGTMAVALAEAELHRLDALHQIVGYALESPITSVSEVIREVPPGTMLPQSLLGLAVASASEISGFSFERCTPMSAYPGFARPVLIQHSERDELAPVSMAHKIFEALPVDSGKELKIYAKGRHSAAWNAQSEEFERDVAAFWKHQADSHRRALRAGAPSL